MALVICAVFTSEFVFAQKLPAAIKWYSLEEAQQLAKANNKKVLIFGHATWCPYCRRMENEVYVDERIIYVINEYYYVAKLDSESSNEIVFNGEKFKEAELAAKLRLFSLPTHYFVDEQGKILGNQPGFLPVDMFEKLLGFVGSDSYESVKFNDYSYVKN